MNGNPIVDYWFEEAAKPAENTPGERDVRAVILEANLEGGVDVLAAFAGGRARFLNRTGDISMWEGGGGEKARLTTALLQSATAFTLKPIELTRGRTPEPVDGVVRISVFTGLGKHVAEGTIDEFEKHPVFETGVDLMNALEGI